MSSSPRPREIFLLRLTGAILASAAFGLIAAAGFPPWNFWLAVGLGFLFGTAFIGGTGYRILRSVWQKSSARAPASWSGATAGSALFAAALWAVVCLVAVPWAAAPWAISASLGHPGAFVVLAYGIAINIAYLPVKMACLKVGCCAVAAGHTTPANVDLRQLEIALTIGILAMSAALATLNIAAGGIVAIGGHLGVRALSRHLRNRGSWGWPPLRQPGSEIAPLLLLLCLSVIGAG